MKSSRILSMLLMTALLLMAAVSIASAQYLIPGETPEQLLQRADTEIFIKAPVLTQDYSVFAATRGVEHLPLLTPDETS